MSEQHEFLRQQLEQATSREPSTAESLDAATAELREGWLELSRLLESADAELNPVSLPDIHITQREPRRRWWSSLALAASLLLAVSAAWLGLRTRSAAILPSTPAGPPAITQSVPIVPGPDSLGQARQPGELRWDDAWDEKLAQVDRSLVSLHGWPDADEPALQIVNQHLRQISQEMNTEL